MKEVNEVSSQTDCYAIMTAKPGDSESSIQNQLQAVVLRAAVGRSIRPIESAINICATQFSEGKKNPKDILDAFPEDLGVKVYC